MIPNDPAAGPLSIRHSIGTRSQVLYGSLWFTAFSPRPLVEDGSQFSNSVEVGNLQVGWRRGQWQFAADVFNVFGSQDFQQSFAEDELFVIPLAPIQSRFTVTRYY